MKTTEYLIHRKIKDTDYCKFVSSENTVIEYKPIVLGVGLEFQVSVIFSDNGKSLEEIYIEYMGNTRYRSNRQTKI